MEREARKLEYWVQHHQSWQASGLSQVAYCQREGLSFSSFDHWRRRARAAMGLTSATSALPPPTTKPLNLVPVEVKSTAPASEIVLQSPSGWQLRCTLNILEVVLPLLRQLP
jgi:hypothetical protein